MTDDERTTFLNLTHLAPDRAVTQRLPLDVARHCRALPVAEDGGVVTVVMAEPADRLARQAVLAALDQRAAKTGEPSPQVYFVQGDATRIDAWLADLALSAGAPDWLPAGTLDIWLREPMHGDQAAVNHYAAQVAALLAAPLRCFDPRLPWPALVCGPASQETRAGAPQPVSLPQPAASQRLVIVPCVDFNLPGPLQSHGAGGGPAMLYACRPRWPLRRLLLIVRGDPVDGAALAWAARLGGAAGSATTALMIAPHIPGGQASPSAQRNLRFAAYDDISSLLSANNAIGHKMRQAAQRLDALQLDVVLHLRQGAPEGMIREELASAPYDLVIAGVAARGDEAQWRLRPLLHKLLPDLDCPLLLTRGR